LRRAPELVVKLVVTVKDGTVVEVDAQPGWSVMENIRDLPQSVEAICGGMCACATCHVYVDPDWIARLAPRRYEERAMLETAPSFDPLRSRLSCQIVVTQAEDGLKLTVAPDA
jgi:2Fe-2S ferredoxin